MTNTISNTDDTIDIRDVIARIEELRNERADLQETLNTCDDGEPTLRANVACKEWDEENAEELRTLEALLEECKGNGGDEQYEGDWYPVTLIRDSYFEDYAQELADDIGAIPKNVAWPCTCIDWEKAARELRMDYTTVDFDGVDYYTR